MYEEIEKAVKQLKDSNAGWVLRRDAAEKLGNYAAQSLGVLKKLEEEPDVDVRRCITEALENASAGLAGIEPKETQTEHSLEELVKACEKEGKRTVEPKDDGYAITVKLKDGRHQIVYVSPLKRKDGHELIRVFTYCGTPSDEALEWALRTNTKLVQGALALWDEDGEQKLVLLNCFFASEVTINEMRAAIKEISYYGDWIENKLTGLDEF